MKKRILAFVLALCMVFALAACGPKTENNDNQNNNSNTTDEKVVKIGIFEPASGDNGAGGKQEGRAGPC